MPAAAPPAPVPAATSAAGPEDIEMSHGHEPAASNGMDVDAHAPLMPLHGDGDIVEL